MLLKISFTIAEDDHALIILDAAEIDKELDLEEDIEMNLYDPDFFNSNKNEKHYITKISRGYFPEEELSKLDFGDLIATGFIELNKYMKPEQLKGCYLN